MSELPGMWDESDLQGGEADAAEEKKRLKLMLQHDQLFNRFLIFDERTGDLIEIPAEQAGQQFVNFRLICNKANVHPDWFNVMRASGLMYQQLENQAQSLQELAEICTQADLKLLAGELQSMLQAIRLTQRCALEGVETCVAKFN